MFSFHPPWQIFNFFVPAGTRSPQWTYNRTIAAPDAATSDEFGYAVATDGTFVVVGAPFGLGGTAFETPQGGKVYVYTAPAFSQPVILTAPDAAISDFFGYAVGMSG